MDADDLARGRDLLANQPTDDNYNPSRQWQYRPKTEETGYLDGADGYPVGCPVNGGLVIQDKDQAELIVWAINNLAALLDAAERAARLEAALREALAVMAYDHAVTGDVDHATNEAARLLRAALEQPKGAGGA